MLLEGERLSWLKLNMVPGLTPQTFKSLIEGFGGAVNVFEASHSALKTVLNNEAVIGNIINFTSNFDLDRELSLIESRSVTVTTLLEENYPEALKTICDPPPVLYIEGTFHQIDRLSIAVVGSRKASPYGLLVAERISSQLAERGITVISGFAMGIDSAAHRGCLMNNGRTLASLGCGLSRNYPARNYQLGRKIVENGALISEFPMLTEAFAFNFPRRNRIISGLSLGTLVVEAAERSGALLTANIALEQNREVFAVPGNINSKYSKGTNELIKSGAKLVNCCQDIIDELKPRLQELGIKLTEVKTAMVAPENEAQNRIIKILEIESKSVDEIINLLGDNPQEVMSHLSLLEVKGVIRQYPGKFFGLC